MYEIWLIPSHNAALKHGIKPQLITTIEGEARAAHKVGELTTATGSVNGPNDGFYAAFKQNPITFNHPAI
jgi:hypothetical protein